MFSLDFKESKELTFKFSKDCLSSTGFSFLCMVCTATNNATPGDLSNKAEIVNTFYSPKIKYPLTDCPAITVMKVAFGMSCST